MNKRFWRAAVSFTLTLGLYAVFVQLPSLLPCTDHVAESFALALCAGMGCYLLLGGRSSLLVTGTVILVALTLWMRTYPMLPLGSPLVLGFNVITPSRGSFDIAQGEILTLATGKPTALQPRTSFKNVRCNWMSARGGAFDDPSSCATVYVPPQAENDVVKVSIQPGCGLSNTVQQIKVSILP